MNWNDSDVMVLSNGNTWKELSHWIISTVVREGEKALQVAEAIFSVVPRLHVVSRCPLPKLIRYPPTVTVDKF